MFLTALTMAYVPGSFTDFSAPGTELCFLPVVRGCLPYEEVVQPLPYTCPQPSPSVTDLFSPLVTRSYSPILGIWNPPLGICTAGKV